MIPMKTRLISSGAVLLLGVLVTGCGDFWQNPNGTGTGGTATTTTLSPSTTTPTVGASVTLTATVSPAAATGTVTFDSNSGSMGTGTLTAGTATLATSFTTAGTYSLTAIYGGDSTYASSTSSAVSVTVSAAAASGTSFTGAFNAANTGRRTNVVTDPAGTWAVTATSHVASLSGVAVDGDTIENIDGEGHCVFYSGTVYTSAGAKDDKGIYALSGGGFLAPEGTADLDCN
jgi:Bacterial Ig-like domain (group 3)